MGWREDLIARHTEAIASMSEGVEWLESGKQQMNDVDSGGKATNMNADIIAHYKRAIEGLNHVVDRLKADIAHDKGA